MKDRIVVSKLESIIVKYSQIGWLRVIYLVLPLAHGAIDKTS
jgi:hypothetical protein